MLVVVVLAGVAVATRSPSATVAAGPPPSPSALASASDAESSAWYCTGQTTAAGHLAPGVLILTNTSRRTVSGAINGVTDTGATVLSGVSIPALGQVVAGMPTPKSGTWLSEVVSLSGGGVTVAQALWDTAGWAQAPCQSSTAKQWYFPSGVTTGTNSMFISLFNPTSTPDVVDLSFVTAKGVMHPINFQGIVLPPGQTEVESVAPYVQDEANISTTVSTRTGRLVAGELQLFSYAAGGGGLAIMPGSPRPEQEWASPQNEEVANGSSSFDIFNPGPTAQTVTVRASLGSGPLSPIRAKVAPDTTWVLATGKETRIPQGDPYAVTVSAQGGSGIVVGRLVAAPPSATAPQIGMTILVDGLSAAAPGRRWVVPAPGSGTTPVVPGVAPTRLALTNLAGKAETFVVEVMAPSGLRALASGRLGTGQSFGLGTPILARAGLNPLVVRTSGATAVSEDVGPSGSLGVVTQPGIPLSLDPG
jgi:Family of unknown function (DUF5719)